MTENLRIDCDVAIAGGGAGGSPVAALLAEAGLEVVLLEEGGIHGPTDFDGRPANMMRRLYRDAGQSWILGPPPIWIPQPRTFGGSTVVGSGMSCRPESRKLDEWRNRWDLKSISEERLNPYLSVVEKDLGAGRTPESRWGPHDLRLAQGAVQAGFSVEAWERFAPECRGCGVCAFGCPSGGKRTAQETYLARADRVGDRLYADARVDGVFPESGGQLELRGVFLRRYTAKAVRSLRVRAKAVVLSAGAFGTPRILRRSALPAGGLKPGQRFTLHPAVGLLAVFDEPLKAWNGIPQSIRLRQEADPRLWAAGFFAPPEMIAQLSPGAGYDLKSRMADYPKMGGYVVHIEEQNSGGEILESSSGGEQIRYRLDSSDIGRMKKGLISLVEALARGGARKIQLGSNRARPLDPLAAREAIDDSDASEWLLGGFHPTGTCPMGSRPAEGTVDADGRVWGVENLYISDASVFPSAPGVPPQLTVMAFAHRLANHLLNDRRDALGGRK